MTARSIDVNADVGEATDPAGMDVEQALLGWVTSANIACGGHAGDEESMQTTLRRASARGAVVGAHPSYPDRAGFGRVEMPLSPLELEASVAEQIATLGENARRMGMEIVHLKPHGALYHAANRRPEVAEAIARAAARWSPKLVLVGQAGSAALPLWRSRGFRVAGEAFADRRYERDGTLRVRTREGALLTDPREAVAQALSIARGEGVVAADGTRVAIQADTLCVHADTPGAPRLAQAVQEALAGAGFLVRPLGSLSGG